MDAIPKELMAMMITTVYPKICAIDIYFSTIHFQPAAILRQNDDYANEPKEIIETNILLFTVYKHFLTYG